MNDLKLMSNALISAFVFVTINLSSAALVQAEVSDKPSGVSTVSIQNKQRGSWRGGQRGGGSRTVCGEEVKLTALVPEFKDSSGSVAVGGVTVSEHPTLWFHISGVLDEQSMTSFSLVDHSGEEVYKISSTEFSAAQQTPGVIGITVPITLDPEQLYYWTLQIRCGSGVYYVDGGIERVLPDPALTQQLTSLSPRAQADLYWQNGIWYDALTVIATHLNSDENANSATEADWQHILQLVELSDIPVPAQP